mmetsp:Transcript_54941/g.91317  ORF Transcript_54941/g.91317 Transcript_54941/m.91317 type:complete len:325 (+) Transcript_54941:460-1434(+)
MTMHGITMKLLVYVGLVALVLLVIGISKQGGLRSETALFDTRICVEGGAANFEDSMKSIRAVARTSTNPPFLVGVVDRAHGGQTLPGEIALKTGTWDIQVLDILDKVIGFQCQEKAILMLDVGSNVGFFSLFAASRGCQTIGVEAHPHYYQTALFASALNGFKDRTEYHNVFVGSGAPMKTVDEIVGKRTPFVWKMDVEGHEYEVLLGSTNTLSKRDLQHVILEYTPLLMGNGDGVKLFELMNKAGFKPYLIPFCEITQQPKCGKPREISKSNWKKFDDDLKKGKADLWGDRPGTFSDIWFTRDFSVFDRPTELNMHYDLFKDN